MVKYVEMLIVILLSSEALAQNINTPENFPDPIFRAVIERIMGVEPGGEFTADQAAQIKEIECGSWGITDLSGIQYFTGVDHLMCNNNNLTELDLSNNHELYFLRCFENQLTRLHIPNQPKFVALFAGGNQMTEIDISNAPALQFFDVSNNQFTELDVSNNPALLWIYCYGNQLTELDVSNNDNLEWLACGWNQLTSISSIVENKGLSKGNPVDVRYNNLDLNDPEIMETMIALQMRFGEPTFATTPFEYVASGFAYLPQNEPPTGIIDWAIY